MRLFKKLASFLGFREEDHRQQEEDNVVAADDFVAASPDSKGTAFARRGFSIPVERPLPPLLVYCPAGDGGIQGLRWYARRLRIDEDGDVADEFLEEVLLDDRSFATFKAKQSSHTQPARVRNLALLPNGKIQHLVEHQGKLEWV